MVPSHTAEMDARKPEWIEAEQALIEACERALASGLRLVYDCYGLEVNPEGYFRICEDKQVCALGSYLAGKQNGPGGSPWWYGTAATYLGVPYQWAEGLERAFAGLPLTEFSKEAKDGEDTGYRLRQRFQPGSIIES